MGFMGDFYYQTHHILERHLKVGAKMSLKQMLDNSKHGKDFDVMRGPSLKVFTKEENGEMTTFVNYDGVVARIVRPDIECTNGFIHLIDKVVGQETGYHPWWFKLHASFSHCHICSLVTISTFEVNVVHHLKYLL